MNTGQCPITYANTNWSCSPAGTMSTLTAQELSKNNFYNQAWQDIQDLKFEI